VIARPCLSPECDATGSVVSTPAVSAAISTATAPTPGTAAARGPRPSLVDGEPPSFVVVAVESLDGSIGLRVVGLLDEPEPAPPAGFAIVENLGRSHDPIRFE